MPTRFLYRAATGNTVPSGTDRCCLCGLPCADTVPVGDVIRDTFTNHGMLRAQQSRVVCPACAYYFNHRWAREGLTKLTEYRLLSLLVTTHEVRPWERSTMRADLERMLHDGCPGCLLVVSLSKKKHLLPLTRVNPPGRCFTVGVEEEQVRLEPPVWQTTARAFDALLGMGIPKGAILTGQYHPVALRKAPLAEVLFHDRVLAPWRPSGLLTLLSYVTLAGDDPQ